MCLKRSNGGKEVKLEKLWRMVRVAGYFDGNIVCVNVL
jgi:hypothetical protein